MLFLLKKSSIHSLTFHLTIRKLSIQTPNTLRFCLLVLLVWCLLMDLINFLGTALILTIWMYMFCRSSSENFKVIIISFRKEFFGYIVRSVAFPSLRRFLY